jgi:ABC-type uncharacterized transport system involved in gliding motility auxiliary subunit
MERVDRFFDRASPYLAIAGLVGLFAAGSLVLVGGDLVRYAPFVALIGVVLMLDFVIVQRQQVLAALSGRSARYGGNTVAMTVALIAILVLVNMLSVRFNQRLDLTESREFTLSPQTVKVLSELRTPVTITAFYQDGQGKEQIDDVLKQFSRGSTNLTYEFVDPVLKPGLAKQYGVQFGGTTIVEANGKRQTVMGSSEGDLISGVIKVVRSDPKKVYFLAGHGELGPDTSDQAGLSSAKAALTAENYKVETLTLMSTGKVPDDAAVVIAAAPQSPMQPQELQALLAYLDGGGKALLLAEPQRLVGLPELAERFGVEIGKGIIIEPAQNLQGDPLTPIVGGPGYLYSDITRNMPADTVFPLATMVRARQGAPNQRYTVTPLIQTTDRAWMETDLANPRPSFDPNADVRGPVSMGVSVTSNPDPGAAADAPRKATRLVVIGDVDFATNNVITLGGDRDFFVNSVNWLAEEESLIGVRAKDPTSRRLALSGAQTNMVAIGSILVMPVLVLGVGAFVLWGRGRGR